MNSIKKCQCYAPVFRLFPSTSLCLRRKDWWSHFTPCWSGSNTLSTVLWWNGGKFSLTTFEQISIALFFLLLMEPTVNHHRNIWQVKFSAFFFSKLLRLSTHPPQVTDCVLKGIIRYVKLHWYTQIIYFLYFIYLLSSTFACSFLSLFGPSFLPP